MFPRRMVAVGLWAAASGVAAADQRPMAADPELLRGKAQVQAGAYDEAIETLQSVVRRLYGDATQVPTVAQAYLHMGAAHLGLGQTDAAVAVFDAALELGPHLRLASGELSPEAAAQFEEVRRRRSASTASVRASRRKGMAGRVGVAAASAGAVAAGGLVLIRATEPPPVALTLSQPRFASSVVVCPDGAQNAALPYALLFEAATTQDVEFGSALTQPLFFGSSVGFQTSTGSVAPMRLPANSSATVRVDSSLACSNTPGNTPQSVLWRIRGSLSTSIGTFYFETRPGELLRVDMP